MLHKSSGFIRKQMKNNINNFWMHGRQIIVSIMSYNSNRIDYYRQIANTEDAKKIGKAIDPETWNYFNNEQKDSLNKLKDYTYSNKKE